MQILGAIDGNLLNPFRNRQDYQQDDRSEDYYGSIKSDQVVFSSKYGRDKLQQMKDEAKVKENGASLKYKYAEEDKELQERATRLQQEATS